MKESDPAESVERQGADRPFVQTPGDAQPRSTIVLAELDNELLAGLSRRRELQGNLRNVRLGVVHRAPDVRLPVKHQAPTARQLLEPERVHARIVRTDVVRLDDRFTEVEVDIRQELDRERLDERHDFARRHRFETRVILTADIEGLRGFPTLKACPTADA